MDDIYAHIRSRLAALEIPTDSIEFEAPPNITLGDLAMPCFVLGKTMKRSPIEIARGLAVGFAPDEVVTKVQAVGPYLNFTIAPAKINTAIIESILHPARPAKRNEQIVIEFFHANTHKAVHIGHIRNISYGAAVANLIEYAGYEVKRVNYQGDIGPHVAKCLWALLQQPLRTPPKEMMASVWLAELYAAGHKAHEDDPAAATEIREINKKIYDGDPALRELWEETRRWCLADFEKLYQRFGITFDRLYFESEVEDRAKKLARELVEDGVLKESQGAIIADLTEQKLDVLVIVTSDGAPLYGAKDLALAELKAHEFPKLTRSIHVVAHEQEFYFKQLLVLFERARLALGGKSEHLVYGLVRLPEGKMSSRTGTVVTYDDVWAKLYGIAVGEVAKRHNESAEQPWDEKKANQIAERVALAALRVGMLRNEPNKEIIFDWDLAMRLDGDTGPYLLYTYARIQSILAKATTTPVIPDSLSVIPGRLVSTRSSRGGDPKSSDLGLLTTPEEREVISRLMSFNSAITRAAEERKPNLLLTNLFEIAHSYNAFYHAHSVLSAETPALTASRLELCRTVAIAIERGLGLLGIEIVEQM